MPYAEKYLYEEQASENMKYSRGDIVRFRIGADEIQEGEVQVIEEEHNEDILYINGFSGWAYKVPEERIVSLISE